MFRLIPIWGWVDILFTVFVLLGVCLEADWVQRFLVPTKPDDLVPPDSKREKIRRRGEFLLIVGLAGELACIPFGLWESAVASREAATASERAARTESNNLVLREQVVRLETGRRITKKQAEEFKFLTEHIGKIPIKILVCQMGWDSGMFTRQLRELLTYCGFADPTAGAKGFAYEPNAYFAFELGNTNAIADLYLFVPKEASRTVYFGSVGAGDDRLSSASTNEVEVYFALFVCFRRIGLKVELQQGTEFAFAVPGK